MQEQIETMNLQCGENSLMNQTENNKQIDEESQEANDQDGEIGQDSVNFEFDQNFVKEQQE